MRGLEKEYQQLLYMGMQGDEEARRLCIRIEHDMNEGMLSPMCLAWAQEYAEAGDTMCRILVVENSLADNIENVDWIKLEAWCMEIVQEDPKMGYFLLACLYNPATAGLEDLDQMLDYLRKGHEAGSPQCSFELASYYWVNESDKHSAQEIRDMMELNKNYLSMPEQYSLLAEVCDAQGDWASAMSYLKRWHKQDPKDAVACLQIAWRYAHGEGVRVNAENALKYYQKAANLGSAEGLYQVGVMTLRGEGCRRNVKRGVDFLHRAAEADSAEAFGLLGTMYAEGDGVNADMEKAISYWEQGAELEDGLSCLHLARAYYSGSGVEADPDRAANLLDIAREESSMGDEAYAAILRSVEAYASGMGMPITANQDGPVTEADMQRAIENNDFEDVAERVYMRLCQYPDDEELLRMARFLLKLKVMDEEQVRDYISMLRSFADHYPEVAMMLGDMYYHGEGATRNARSAMLFYQKALEFGVEADVLVRVILGLHEEVLKGGREELPAWLEEVPNAEGNTAPLFYMMGLLYSVGLYVEQSVEKAAEMFVLAEQDGFAGNAEEDVAAWQSGAKTLRECVLPND